jgi:hypothetical protein
MNSSSKNLIHLSLFSPSIHSLSPTCGPRGELKKEKIRSFGPKKVSNNKKNIDQNLIFSLQLHMLASTSTHGRTYGSEVLVFSLLEGTDLIWNPLVRHQQPLS